MKNNTLKNHPVVSQEKWIEARLALMKDEKEATHLRDQVAAKRRELPWVKVDKDYVFDGPKGKVSLADLFEGSSQLVVYHFMFGPGWGEGCRSCSYVSDNWDASIPHLKARDIAFAAISRAPLAEFLPFKQRLGWKFNWVSSFENSFNFDYKVSFTEEQVRAGGGDYNFGLNLIPTEELPGLSVFYKDGDTIYRTYSTYSRGLDILIAAYNVIDMTPKGRNETGESAMDWVQYHDQYAHAATTV